MASIKILLLSIILLFCVFSLLSVDAAPKKHSRQDVVIHPSVDRIFSKVKEAELKDTLSVGIKMNEPDTLVIAPVRGFDRAHRQRRRRRHRRGRRGGRRHGRKFQRGLNRKPHLSGYPMQ
ncbi:unnamed protein product [Trichobilharzia szidati]|nr:unnamed protein product [Trichobilharzia szidati]